MIIKNISIKPFEKTETLIIHNLYPTNWNFDFLEFIDRYFNSKFFFGFTVLENGRPIGFGNLFIFDNVAWIGNIVISEVSRGKGIGKFLMNHLFEFGESRKVQTFILIASEMGIPLYEKLGFKTQEFYGFFQPPEKIINLNSAIVLQHAQKDDLLKILDFDYKINNENRIELLKQHLSDTFISFDDFKNINGLYIKSLDNGLVIATIPEIGIEILKQKINDAGNQIVVPLKNVPAIKFLKSIGYKMYTDAPRMILGENLSWKSEFIYSRGAGYCG